MLQWDKSHKWAIYRYYRCRARVTIVFKQAVPSVAELMALRKCLPQFQHVPPAVFRTSAGSSGKLDLGVMFGTEAHRLIRAAESQGLTVVDEDASYDEDIPVDLTTGQHWCIEDESEAAIVIQTMISEGVPVQVIHDD